VGEISTRRGVEPHGFNHQRATDPHYFAHLQPGDPVADAHRRVDGVAATSGVVFLLCNNALTRWSGGREQGLGTAAEIHADLTAHAVPGVVIVPDVLIAITKAHERGFSCTRS